MKAILEFNMPEDEKQFNTAFNGGKYQGVMERFANVLRMELKYNDALNDDEKRIYRDIQDRFFRCMNEEGVSLFE
jgi:hypothetical protein